MHQCIRIPDPKIRLEIERLPPWTQSALFETVKQRVEESGKISGIPCGKDEYIGVHVEVSEERIGYLATVVKTIDRYFRYSRRD